MKGYPLVKKRLLRLWLSIDRQLAEVLRLVLLWIAREMVCLCYREMGRASDRAMKEVSKVRSWAELTLRFEKSKLQLEADLEFDR